MEFLDKYKIQHKYIMNYLYKPVLRFSFYKYKCIKILNLFVCQLKFDNTEKRASLSPTQHKKKSTLDHVPPVCEVFLYVGAKSHLPV